MVMTTPKSSPDIVELVSQWQADAKKHALAALEDDCEVGDDEWCLHRESARIYRKCADHLAAIVPATLSGGVAQARQGAVQDLPLFWQGRANALRILDERRGQSDHATLETAWTYEECAKELRAALSSVSSTDRDGQHMMWCPVSLTHEGIEPLTVWPSTGSFLGYRDASGNEMHCRHMTCPHEIDCRKRCICPTAVTSKQGNTP